MDLSETIIPKSDQLNAEDMLAGPMTVTVASVSKGNAEQPVDIHLVETPGRAYRPSKTMRKVLVRAWGKEGDAYPRRRMTLYRDPDVKFGGQKVGGIKISHLSHLDKPLALALTETRGKRVVHTVEPLTEAARPTPAAQVTREQVARLQAALAALGIAPDDAPAVITDELGRTIGHLRELTPAEVDRAADALERMATPPEA